MNQKTIQEYQSIISGYFTRATTDREANAKLAEFSKELRGSIKDIAGHLKSNPNDPQMLAYVGAMFYGSIQTTNLRLVRYLEDEEVAAPEAIAQLREKKALQLSTPATEDALWLLSNHPDFLWVAIQLVLLHAPKKAWSTSVSTSESGDESSDDNE